MNQNKLFTQLLFSRDHVRNQNWNGIGSAIFIYLDGAFYLLTAAHVFTENLGFGCYLNINGTPIDLARYQIKKNSELDIAAIRLEEQDYIAIAEHTFFITESMLRNKGEEAVERKIILMGYPRSKNRAKLRNQGIQTTVWQHISIDCTEKHNPEYEEHRSLCFAAAYDPKNTENKHGKKERAPEKLNGISGGVAIEFFINTDDKLRYCPMGMIQGMSSKSKLVYGVTINHLFLWLEHNAASFELQRRS